MRLDYPYAYYDQTEALYEIDINVDSMTINASQKLDFPMHLHLNFGPNHDCHK